MTARNQITLLTVAGVGMSLTSILDYFDPPLGSQALYWVLIAPGILACPAFLWIAWKKYRELKATTGSK